MDRNLQIVLYIVAMGALIAAVDILLLRDRFWPRLIVNIVIVLTFALGYWRFFKGM